MPRRKNQVPLPRSVLTGSEPAQAMPRAAISPAKLNPYVPQFTKIGGKKDAPRTSENLNGKVAVQVDGAEDKMQVTCTHLAIEYLHNKKFIDNVAQSRDGIAKHFSNGGWLNARDKTTVWLNAPAEAKQLISNKGFGTWLRDIGANLNQNGQSAGAMILTGEHAMAVRIQRKVDPERGTRFRVTCYDPNGNPASTGNHLAFESNSLAGLAGHSLEDLFSHLPKYYPGIPPKSATVTAICPSVIVEKPEQLKYLSTGNGRHALKLALAQGFTSDAVDRLCQRIKAGGNVDEKAMKFFLRGEGESQTALHLAAHSGLTQAFVSTAHALKALGVKSEYAQQVLNAHNEQGSTSLELAVASQHLGAFPEMGKALALLEMNESMACEVLESKNSDGIALLYLSAGRGLHKAFPAMAQAAKAAGLSKDAVKHLLEAPSPDGISALTFAVAQEHPGTFTSFARALKIAGIHGQEALDILNAKGPDCIENATAFELAHHTQNTALINDYSKAVALLSPPLRPPSAQRGAS